MRKNVFLALLLLALIFSASLIPSVEAKKKGKKDASGKTAAAAATDAAEADKKTWKNNNKKWNSMSNQEWEKLEREAEGPDDRVNLSPPSAPAAFDPSDPTAFLKANKKGKPSMIFVNVKGNPDRKATEDVAFKWQNLMSTAALEVTPYVLEAPRILFTVMDGAKGYDVMDFCMQQSETEYIEWEQQKYYPETWKKSEL